MKLQHRLFASVLFLLLSPMSANAVPITFTFDMPAFTSGGLTGSTSVLEVTADNGGSSALNQVFLNTQVTGLSSDLTGGLVVPIYYIGSAIYITTDSQGVAAFTPPPYTLGGTAVYAYSGTQYIQLGSYTYSNYYVQQDLGRKGYIHGASNFPITSRPSQVSEPGTLALLAAGLGFMYRRKSVGGRV